MPQTLLRRRWLRTASTSALLCLSLTSFRSLNAAEGLDTADSVAQLSPRNTPREVEAEDKGEYPGLTIAKQGFSTTAARKQAITDLKLERLSPEAQRKSQSLLKNLGMYRHLPTLTFECDPNVYEYFLQNPDVAVSTWRAMEISQFQLQETSPRHYRADAGDGSIGEVELLLQTPSETMILCDGAFKSPLLPKPIVARSLMRLQTTFSKDQDGRVFVTHSGDVFVEFPSHAVEAVAKVISPVSHSIADRNFKQMTLFVHLMSQAMAKHPIWVEQVGGKLDGIQKQKKAEFLEVAGKSCDDARKRFAAATASQAFSPEEMLTPYRQYHSATPASGTSNTTARGTSIRQAQATTPANQGTTKN